MGYGTAVREVRAHYGRTQDDVARSVHISDSMLSDIERERRPAAPDTLRALAVELDDPQLYIEASLAVTGGVGSPWLNNVDRHRMAMKAKVREELQEVLDAFNEIQALLINAKQREQLTPEALLNLKKVIFEMIEAKTALKNYIGELCRIYQISQKQMYKEHYEKLIKSGYLRKEKSA